MQRLKKENVCITDQQCIFKNSKACMQTPDPIQSYMTWENGLAQTQCASQKRN